MPSTRILSIDFGTSRCKTSVIDEKGDLGPISTAETGLRSLGSGLYGQDGDALEQSVANCTSGGDKYDSVSRAVSTLETSKAVPVKADATDTPGLKQLFGRNDIVINSTWYQFNLLVMEAAIQAGIHYVDLGGLYHLTVNQLELEARARDAGSLAFLEWAAFPER